MFKEKLYKKMFVIKKKRIKIFKTREKIFFYITLKKKAVSLSLSHPLYDIKSSSKRMAVKIRASK